MILGTLTGSSRYSALHPGFAAAFEFLGDPRTAGLADGRCELDGDRLYAMVFRKAGKGRAGAALEAHRKYIDIQFTVAGAEVIGWSGPDACAASGQGYDAETDLELCTDAPSTWVAVPPGNFAVFFPEDAHAPMAGEGMLHKVVVKVAVTQ